MSSAAPADTLPESLSDAADDSTAADSAESSAADSKPALPTDAAEWRALLPQLPAKELVRLIAKDKAASARLFAGFRAGTDTVRRAIVVQRVAEAAAKEPKFAEALGALIPSVGAPISPFLPPVLGEREPENSTEHLSDSPSPNTGGRNGEMGAVASEDPRLRDKLKEQRAALREKDARIAALEAGLAAAQRERDAARSEAEAARAAQRAATEEMERARHKRERDDRREAQATAARAAAEAAAPRVSAAAAVAAAPVASMSGRLVEEALQRLLTRGRYVIAAEVCREALAAESGAEASAGDRGRIHALYAISLYGQGNLSGGDEQDRIAAGHLLDAGELPRAAEALGRILTQSPNLKPSSLTPLFRRLSALAEKMGQTDAVNDVLTHVRISSPEASRRLTAALSGGDTTGRQRVSLMRNITTTRPTVVGPDEVIALPNAHSTAATVTARAIVAAVDSGDAFYVAQVRGGIRALQAREGNDRVIAGALLEAVAKLDTTAALPLAQPANQPIVVDASNVARHNPDPLALVGVPRVLHLVQMRDYLLGRGFFPVYLIADANLRFHVNDRAAYEALIARGIVRETPPGTSADEALIAEARDYAAPLVTNDRLADWDERADGIERLNFALLATGATLTPI